MRLFSVHPENGGLDNNECDFMRNPLIMLRERTGIWRSNRIYRDVVRPRIDLARFAAIRSKYVQGDPPYKGYSKYFDLDTYCLRDTRRAVMLGLDKGPPRRVLDVGCGMGYFLHCCRCFGHTATGIDIPESSKYQDLVDLLGLHRVLWEVTAEQPFPELDGRFDLITAFQVTFNKLDTPEVWGSHEWDRFFEAASAVLNPGGRVFLQLNLARDGTWYSDTLLAHLRRLGAEVRGPLVDHYPRGGRR